MKSSKFIDLSLQQLRDFLLPLGFFFRRRGRLDGQGYPFRVDLEDRGEPVIESDDFLRKILINIWLYGHIDMKKTSIPQFWQVVFVAFWTFLWVNPWPNSSLKSFAVDHLSIRYPPLCILNGLDKLLDDVEVGNTVYTIFFYLRPSKSATGEVWIPLSSACRFTDWRIRSFWLCIIWMYWWREVAVVDLTVYAFLDGIKLIRYFIIFKKSFTDTWSCMVPGLR